MRLSDALDLCTDAHQDDWVRIPGERPATAIIAGLFDPGAAEPRTRPLAGHTIVVYEPDARLSLVWPVPDEDEAERPDRYERFIPDWAEQDDHEWKNARAGWVVVLLNGAPTWQERVWYLDWGSGVGGYVADFQARFGELVEGVPSIDGWEASVWAVGLTRLLNGFSATGEFFRFDPTPRIVPKPSPLHPIDAGRDG